MKTTLLTLTVSACISLSVANAQSTLSFDQLQKAEKAYIHNLNHQLNSIKESTLINLAKFYLVHQEYQFPQLKRAIKKLINSDRHADVRYKALLTLAILTKPENYSADFLKTIEEDFFETVAEINRKNLLVITQN